MTTPSVQYRYANGSGNQIRPTRTTYPDGRELNLDYGSASGQADLLSRVAALIDDDGTTHLTDYSYLGLGTPAITDYAQPDVMYTLVGTAGGDDPDTGDIYRGLDRFGRVKDAYWRDYGASADAARIQYGYDRAGNRTYRADPVAVANSAQYEELYGYDAIQRLKTMDRGTLNGGKTALTAKSFDQCWTLDQTGNWKGFRQDDTGDGAWDLIQARTSNPVNEITNIANSVGSAWANPAYDAAGNMTTLPKPANPTQSYTAKYDAWNRLVKLQDGANTVAEYQYDARNYRTVQKSYTAGVLSETRHLYYTKKWQAIEERVGTSPDSAAAERQFVWGRRYIDNLVLRDRDTDGNGTLDERLYALQDANWNVIALANTSGDVQERYAYQAYGTPKFLTPAFANRASSSFGWETLYAGYRWQPATELYHIRNRMLIPILGGWLQRDPLIYIDGHNVYSLYLSLSTTDPFGTALEKCTEKRCDSCVKSAKKDDKIIKQILALMSKKKGGGKACKPNINCTNKGGCENPSLLGKFDQKTFELTLCWNNLQTTKNSCDGVFETLRHELTHQLIACLKKSPGGKDKCQECICEELDAYRVSGQCKDGSVWRTITNYQNEQKCLAFSAARSCDGPCGFINPTDNEIIGAVNKATPNCNSVSTGDDSIINLD